MNNVVTIKTSMDQHSELIIHPEKAAAIDLGSRKFAYLSFGNQKHDVKIRMNHEISQKNVLLSRNLIKELHLPDYPIYEICINQNEIIVGPYIGLLISNEDNKLIASRLNKMLVYVKEYAKLHGSVVVFALNKVDQENRLIEGYCYNPVKKCWQQEYSPTLHRYTVRLGSVRNGKTTSCR